MFSKWYERKRQAAQVQEPEYVVRDRATGQIIASGTKVKCEAYVSGFGLCYMEEARGR